MIEMMGAMDRAVSIVCAKIRPLLTVITALCSLILSISPCLQTDDTPSLSSYQAKWNDDQIVRSYYEVF